MHPVLILRSGALHEALHKLSHLSMFPLTNQDLRALIILIAVYWLYSRFLFLKSICTVQYLALSYQKYCMEDIPDKFVFP